jgi:hypothetical protein
MEEVMQKIIEKLTIYLNNQTHEYELGKDGVKHIRYYEEFSGKDIIHNGAYTSPAIFIIFNIAGLVKDIIHNGAYTSPAIFIIFNHDNPESQTRFIINNIAGYAVKYKGENNVK